jgi:hypothetical protein
VGRAGPAGASVAADVTGPLPFSGLAGPCPLLSAPAAGLTSSAPGLSRRATCGRCCCAGRRACCSTAPPCAAAAAAAAAATAGGWSSAAATFCRTGSRRLLRGLQAQNDECMLRPVICPRPAPRSVAWMPPPALSPGRRQLRWPHWTPDMGKAVGCEALQLLMGQVGCARAHACSSSGGECSAVPDLAVCVPNCPMHVIRSGFLCCCTGGR